MDGHEVGIAEYVIGAMLALTRGFCRLDARLRLDRGMLEARAEVIAENIRRVVRREPPINLISPSE